VHVSLLVYAHCRSLCIDDLEREIERGRERTYAHGRLRLEESVRVVFRPADLLQQTGRDKTGVAAYLAVLTNVSPTRENVNPKSLEREREREREKVGQS